MAAGTTCARTPMIVGPSGPKVKLSTGKTVLNFASYNIFNFAQSDYLKDRAISTLRAYGVGPCGPPGFYGTQDLRIKTEADVAFGFLPALSMHRHSIRSALLSRHSQSGEMSSLPIRLVTTLFKTVFKYPEAFSAGMITMTWRT